MEQNNRPQGRQKRVGTGGQGVRKRGDGLGTGPVGTSNSNPHNTNANTEPSAARPQTGGAGGGARASGGGGKGGLIAIILAAVAVLGGGGGLLGLFGGNTDAPADNSVASGYTDTGGYAGNGGSGASAGGATLANPFQSLLQSGTAADSTATASAVADLDVAVAPGSREKRTNILGGGQDTVTVMVYMCGTDLESKYGMGTNDLTEMCNATLGNNLRVLVYTGGCSKWNNNVVSTDANQIYEIAGGGLKRLEADMGSAPMTNPSTLTTFIQWCALNYPANRNELILWDHGGGSVSGYGYDEKYPRTGSMSLAGIDEALKNAGVTFDFVGFDACLMATVETGLMLGDYADYMVASEETEPGIGWYYTDWLTALGRNTSMPTAEIGKNIIDSFVATCASQARGQSATLSVVDLAELSNTAPAALKNFSESLSTMISAGDYSRIATARSQTREFAQSSAIDQIDLVDFAQRVGSGEGAALAEAMRGAVKYNRTSSDMSRSYGLSIYFPYRKTFNVDSAVDTYNAIGLDPSYSECIRAFASLEISGQVSTGGFNTNALSALLGNFGGTSSFGGADAISGLLGSFLSSGAGGGFFSGRALSEADTVSYIEDHFFDPANLTWTKNSAGEDVIALPDEQWALVTDLAVNMFYDDGEGFIDLGLDNTYEWDESGNLLGAPDRTWLSVNGQPVAFYCLNSDGASTTGYIPAMLNGERVELLVIFNGEHPYGEISGARPVYPGGETDTVAKNLAALEPGDTLEFLCDYYTYGGEYLDTYYLGEPMTVTDSLELYNVDVGEGAVRVTYRFTDIYNQHYWTEPFDSAASAVTVTEDGEYTTPEDVAEYLYAYDHLPGNYITKKEAQALGWSGGDLWQYAPGKSIGGDYFGNYEGLLPKGSYHECDVNYSGGSRGAERIIYGTDGSVWYTGDHYASFTQLY